MSREPFADIAATCARLGSLVALTLLLACGWFAANTTSLYVLTGGAVPWRSLLWNRFVGEGLNATIPLAGVAGEPLKVRHLSRWMPVTDAVAAVVNDRFIENATGLLFTAVCLVAGIVLLPVTRGVATGLVLAGAIAAVAAVVLTLVVLSRFPGRLGRWIAGGEATVARRISARRASLAAAACLVGRLFGVAELLLLMRLLDLPGGFTVAAFTVGAIAAAGFVGFAIPQGIGVSEAAVVFAFALVGLPGPAAIAVGFARRGRMLIMSAIGLALRPFGRVPAGIRRAPAR